MTTQPRWEAPVSPVSSTEVDALDSAVEVKRFAREIHETFLQHLLEVGTIADEALHGETLSNGARESVAQIVELSVEATRDLREAVSSAKTQPMLPLPLGAALEKLTSGVPDLAVELHVDDALVDARGLVAVALDRACREGVSNVGRHAAAKRCVVRCTVDGRCATARVEDDEVGLQQPVASHHLGSLFLREAFAELGGTVDTAALTRGGRAHRACAGRSVPSGRAGVSDDG